MGARRPGRRDDLKDHYMRILLLVLIPITFTACTPAPGIAPILLFNGTGTSANDVAALEAALNSSRLNYTTANSSQLNQMGESRIREYRLLIVPGGNFVDIGNSLTSSTTASIRNAVRNGLNYLGICAGAFFAGD